MQGILKFFIGCYTANQEFGIQFFEYQTSANEFTPVDKFAVADASYLTAANNVFYVVNESGKEIDEVTALKWDGSRLTLINASSSGGSGPCYISIGKNAKHVFIANYNDGNVAALPVLSNGSLGAPGQVITHTGQGPNTDRQECAHAHCVELSPDGKFLIACDLGTDKVTIYAYDEDNQQQPLNPAPASVYLAKPGTGPRHIIFSADGKFAYLVGELTAVVIVFKWENGTLKELQQIGMMPADFNGDNCAADIHFSADGNFLYTSNRGTANQLIIYTVDKTTGLLTFKGRQSTLGTGPRNFAIDPSGDLLLVANQVSNDAQLFKIDKTTGMLSFQQSVDGLQAPVFVKFI